jgi:hypothetical protein
MRAQDDQVMVPCKAVVVKRKIIKRENAPNLTRREARRLMAMVMPYVIGALTISFQ